MKKSKLIQAFTLFSFIFFIIAFLLYRTGKFDRYFSNEKYQYQTSPNGGNVNSVKTDSLSSLKDYRTKRTRLSSSKTVILTDDRLLLSDSIRKITLADSVKRKNEVIMMSSSKSGPVFKPVKSEPAAIKFDPRKLKGDTIIKQQK
jgi:hypothetical protein